MAIVAVGVLVAFITALVLLSQTAAKVVLYGFFYSIAKALFELCDFLQLCFRRLAGLDTYWFKETASSGASSTDGKTGDILLSIFSSKTVIEALIAMTLFAVALLLIVTIVQIIRVEYTTEGSKNSKGTILGKAIKSFAMFILIPVVCFLGIFVSNKILFALDAATSQAGSSTLSGSIFLAGAADANVVRMGGTKEGAIDGITAVYDQRHKAKLTDNDDGLVGLSTTIFRSSKSDTESKRNEIATTIDNMFVRKYNRFDGSKSSNNVYTVGELKDKNDPNSNAIKDRSDDQIIHYSNYDTVKYFYDFSEMNFFIFYVGSAFVLMSFVKASVGLITRLYKGTALFIISPAVTALTPIDDGNAYKSWRKAFMGCVLGAYGYVVALNLLFLIMGVVDNIYLFPNSFGYYTANKMVQCLMVIVGVNMLSDFSGLVSGFIGAEDVLKSGESMSKKVMETTGKVGKMTVQGGMAAAGMFGSVAGRIASKNAVKSETLKNNVDKAKASGDSKKIAKAQKALEKYEAKGNVEQREQKARTRAAVYNRATLRGREMASSMFQDSALGSFLNTATGKMFEPFGGKGLKNLDDKLSEKHSDVYKVANNATTVGDVLDKGAAFAYNLGHDPEESYKKMNATYEENMAKLEAVSDKKVLNSYKDKGNAERYNNYINRDKTYDDFRKQFMEIASKAANKGPGYNPSADDEIKKAMQNLMDNNPFAKNSNNTSRANLNNINNAVQSSVSGSSDIQSIFQNVLNQLKDGTMKFDAGDIAVDSTGTTSVSGYEKNKKRLSGDQVAYDATNLDKIIAEKGLGAVNDVMDHFNNFDENHRPKSQPPEPEKGDEKGNGEGGEKGKGGNVVLENANVKMDNAKTEIKGDAKIEDTKTIADKLNMTVAQAMKKMKDDAIKKDNDKEQKILDMLGVMKKTLDDIKKNTKK